MLRTIGLLAVFALLSDYVLALSGEMEQLKEVIQKFDKDYKQGNVTKLATDFQSALSEYGDGQQGEASVVQEFLKKMESSGELNAMEKLETEWKEYVTALGKHYDAAENNFRMAIFEGNELMTEKINREYEQGLVTYTAALNDLADLTDEEFKAMNGFRLPNETVGGSRRARQASGFYQYNRNERLPNSVDWRTKGLVTAVRNQGQCGSCYAFSTAAALEGYHKKKTGRLLDLSPQNIVDCTGDLGNNGCQGGFMPLAFKYAARYGIALESRYPYVGTVQRCKWNRNIAVVTDNGFNQIRPGDELGLQHAVAKQGPVVVGISGSKRSFRFYKNGVFGERNCGTPDHAVLVVGYGTHPAHGDYYIVKNSWGPGWGDGGYVLMARNKGNICGIASAASFPV